MGCLSSLCSALGLPELRHPSGALALARRLLGEFLGVAVLVALGCGVETGPGSLKTSVAYGLAYMAGVVLASFSSSSSSPALSVGHANPAVTVAAALVGKAKLLHAVAYVLVQCAGSIAGAYLLSLLRPPLNLPPSSLGANVIYAGVYHPNCSTPHQDCYVGRVTAWQAFGAEMLASFVLVVVALAEGAAGTGTREEEPTATPFSSSSAPLTLGLTYALCHLFTAPLTAGGANPARALGPALVASYWDDHWVFWAAPLSGSALAAFFFAAVLAPSSASASAFASASSKAEATADSFRLYRSSGNRREYDVTVSHQEEMLKMAEKEAF